MAKRVRVTQDSESGRNQKFIDTATGRRMTRAEFVDEIERGKYPNYHVRRINSLKTPVSNPDASERNNLD